MTNPRTRSQFKMKYPLIQKNVFPPVCLFLRDLESLGKNSLEGTVYLVSLTASSFRSSRALFRQKPIRRYLNQENLCLAVLRHFRVSVFPKATLLALWKLDWKIRFLPVLQNRKPNSTASPLHFLIPGHLAEPHPPSPGTRSRNVLMRFLGCWRIDRWC